MFTCPRFAVLPLPKGGSMGAETTIYVKVVRPVSEWVEVRAVCLDDAMADAMNLPNVIAVLDAQYDKPE